MGEATSETQTIDLGTHRLRVRHSGTGAVAFVCLHDLGDTLAVWEDVAAQLTPRTRVVRFDQRAHGDSTAPAGTCTRFDLSADLIAVLDRLEIARAVLIGQGLGGLVALTAALESPGRVSGLVLLAAASECDARRCKFYRDVVRAGEVNALEGLARAIYGPTSTDVVVGDAPGITAMARLWVALHDEPLTPRLAEIACPALVLVGERDAQGRTDAEVLCRGLARAQLGVLTGQGRALPAEAASAVAAAIAAWRPGL